MAKYIYLFFTISLALLPTNVTFAAPERPVIVIPGILGSKLCDNKGVVWGNRASLFNFYKLRLPFNFNPKQLQHKPCGVIDNIQLLGPFKIHQYDSLIKHLEGLGYKRDETLHIFPYDWRLSNFHSAELLAQKIKQLIEKSGNKQKKVDIVAHSMGGLIARIYIHRLGGDKHIKKLIMMGTPHLGSGNVFKTADKGWGFWKNLAAGGVKTVRETMFSFPSLYQLLPSYKNCCARISVDGSKKYFKAYEPNLWNNAQWMPKHYHTNEGKKYVANMLDAAKELFTLMRREIPQNVRVENIVTGLIQTRWKTFFSQDTGDFIGNEDYSGDGTVVEHSAANIKLSDARATTDEHSTIFRGETAKKTLSWVLGSDIEPIKGPYSCYKASLQDAGNNQIDLMNISYSTKPQVLIPGANGKIRIKLEGVYKLAQANLSNISIFLKNPNGSKTPLIVNFEHGRTVSEFHECNESIVNEKIVERFLTASFSAPSDFGTHSIEITLPNVSVVEEFIFVLKP